MGVCVENVLETIIVLFLFYKEEQVILINQLTDIIKQLKQQKQLPRCNISCASLCVTHREVTALTFQGLMSDLQLEPCSNKRRPQ